MISLDEAVASLHKGDIIIYPTDTVYGLGCLPSQPKALEKLLAFKNRTRQFIVIIDHWEKHQHWIDTPITEQLLSQSRPTTWIIPATNIVPDELLNPEGEVAIRQVLHQPTHALLNALSEPLVSTSANHPGKKTVSSPSEAKTLGFQVMEGENGLTPPSTIIHYRSGQIIRP